MYCLHQLVSKRDRGGTDVRVRVRVRVRVIWIKMQWKWIIKSIFCSSCCSPTEILLTPLQFELLFCYAQKNIRNFETRKTYTELNRLPLSWNPVSKPVLFDFGRALLQRVQELERENVFKWIRLIQLTLILVTQFKLSLCHETCFNSGSLLFLRWWNAVTIVRKRLSTTRSSNSSRMFGLNSKRNWESRWENSSRPDLVVRSVKTQESHLMWSLVNLTVLIAIAESKS